VCYDSLVNPPPPILRLAFLVVAHLGRCRNTFFFFLAFPPNLQELSAAFSPLLSVFPRQFWR